MNLLSEKPTHRRTDRSIGHPTQPPMQPTNPSVHLAPSVLASHKNRRHDMHQQPPRQPQLPPNRPNQWQTRVMMPEVFAMASTGLPVRTATRSQVILSHSARSCSPNRPTTSCAMSAASTAASGAANATQLHVHGPTSHPHRPQTCAPTNSAGRGPAGRERERRVVNS